MRPRRRVACARSARSGPMACAHRQAHERPDRVADEHCALRRRAWRRKLRREIRHQIGPQLYAVALWEHGLVAGAKPEEIDGVHLRRGAAGLRRGADGWRARRVGGSRGGGSRGGRCSTRGGGRGTLHVLRWGPEGLGKRGHRRRRRGRRRGQSRRPCPRSRDPPGARSPCSRAPPDQGWFCGSGPGWRQSHGPAPPACRSRPSLSRRKRAGEGRERGWLGGLGVVHASQWVCVEQGGRANADRREKKRREENRTGQHAVHGAS